MCFCEVEGLYVWVCGHVKNSSVGEDADVVIVVPGRADKRKHDPQGKQQNEEANRAAPIHAPSTLPVQTDAKPGMREEDDRPDEWKKTRGEVVTMQAQPTDEHSEEQERTEGGADVNNNLVLAGHVSNGWCRWIRHFVRHILVSILTTSFVFLHCAAHAFGHLANQFGAGDVCGRVPILCHACLSLLCFSRLLYIHLWGHSRQEV